MKILVAIESSKNGDKLAHTTLRWAARAGYNLRIFVPNRHQFPQYQKAIEEANYQYYLDLNYSVLVPKERPIVYAKREGYDLLVSLRDDMLDWRTVGDDDQTLMDYVTDIGAARLEFSKDKKKRFKIFENGIKMVRVR